MVTTALYIIPTLHGVENTTTMTSILWKCAAVAVVVVQVAATKIYYLLSVLIQILPLMELY